MKCLLSISCGLFTVLLLGMATTATAKPMPAPTLSQAVRYPHVVVCEYAGAEANEKSTYMGGVTAKYKPVTILAGGDLPTTFSVNYQFHDGSGCIVPPNWTFREKVMPKKGSKWTLFLKPGAKIGSSFQTYRGSFGRMPATDENLAKVRELLKE